MKSPRRLRFSAIALLLVLVSCGAGLEEYRRFPHPNRPLAVVVYRQGGGSALPGQSGDAPGVVRLENGAGKVLAEAPVELVSSVEDPVWSADSVSIKLVADWPLPAGD